MSGGSKSKVTEYTPPPYSGTRPFEAGAVGYGSDVLKGISEQYLPQLMARARGEGQVGYDPKWYETRKRQGLGDLTEAYNEGRKIRSAQASGQGLRGGMPISIERQAQEDFGDATGDFLDTLTTADLEARREDINKAFYQLPEEVSRGTGIQQNRSNFDLGVYEATKPTPIVEESGGSGIWPTLATALAYGAGTAFGSPAGGAVAGSLTNALTKIKQPNKSFSGSTNSSAIADAVTQAAAQRWRM